MSVLADAFAGFTKSLTADSNSPRNGELKSQHAIFVHSQLLPLTLRLQKEMRGRRCKVRVMVWIRCADTNQIEASAG
jgi:hypothetical protein